MPTPERWPPIEPIVCAVSDRRRLTREPGGLRSLVSYAAAAGRAGIDVLQIRERDLDAVTLADVAIEIVAATARSNLAVLVNDRADVAIAAGAAGVHLRGDSMPTAVVRTIVARPLLVGRSVHSAVEAASEGDAPDYLICGPVFPTTAKPGAPVLGAAGLSDAVRAARVPVLGIGGMSLASVAGVARTDASGVAAIGLFADAWNASDETLAEVVATLRQMFVAARRERG